MLRSIVKKITYLAIWQDSSLVDSATQLDNTDVTDKSIKSGRKSF